jgi:hypothetical protein
VDSSHLSLKKENQKRRANHKQHLTNNELGDQLPQDKNFGKIQSFGSMNLIRNENDFYLSFGD